MKRERDEMSTSPSTFSRLASAKSKARSGCRAATAPMIPELVVASVSPSSDAAAKGIQPRDSILSINQRATRTPDEAAAIVAAAQAAGRRSVLLLVQRGNQPAIYVPIELPRR